MKKISYALVLTALIALIICHGPFAFAAQNGPSMPPIKVVVVSGTNYEMGVQYGEQAADLIAANRDVVWNLLDTQVVDLDQSPLGHEVILKDIQVWTYYLEKFDPKLKDWLIGISDGCKNKGFEVSYVDLVAIMILPQELWARPQMPYPDETNVAAFVPGKSSTILAKGRANTQPLASCTAFAATGSATGDVPMVSLTLGFIPEIKLYVILVAYPTEGEPFVSLTVAGKVSNNTGMNGKFAWVMTAAVTDPRTACTSSWGLTSEAYHHYLQQYCKSPKEAMEYLDNTPKGGVTGIFLFADNSGVFAYEVGACASAIRMPGDLNERDFVATANNYNGPDMKDYAIPAEWFSDTYIRYATIFKKLSDAQTGTVGLDFAKACWLSNDWYDAAKDTWHTVPVPNDPDDLNTCNVPGNNCEGGESQVIQFPAQKTVYLQPGGPHGTTIQYYWPDYPEPTGEYTKWQLKDSVYETSSAASVDARGMIRIASTAFNQKADSIDSQTRSSLRRLLRQARIALSKGLLEEATAEYRLGHIEHNRKDQMAAWGAAYTDFATAQLYAQMVSTRLKQY